MHTLTVEELTQPELRIDARRGVPPLVTSTPCPFVEPAFAVQGE